MTYHSPNRRAVLAGAASAIAMASVAGMAKAADGEPIKIGFFAPETGGGAPDGRSAVAGAKLAVEQINASGGIDGRKIDLITYDDGSDPKQGATIATKLTSQDEVVAAVSGSYSPQTLAAATIFQRAGVVMVSAYGINPGIPKTGDEIFMQDVNGNVQGRAGAKFLFDKGIRKPAIVAINNDFGTALIKGFTEEAKKLGMTIVSTDKNQFGEKDFGPVIHRILGTDADAVYLAEYVGEGKQFLRDWHQAGGKLTLFGTEGIDSADFYSIGKLADGLMFTTNLNRDSKSEETQAFLKGFAEAYKFPPDMVAASCYDAIMLLAGAMKRKGTTRADVKAGLQTLSDFVGATGTFQHFADDGQVVKPVQIQVFKDGAIHSAGVVSDSDILNP
jgi:branched-chain amino acid transport system substrate-binding protein